MSWEPIMTAMGIVFSGSMVLIAIAWVGRRVWLGIRWAAVKLFRWLFELLADYETRKYVPRQRRM